MTDHEGFFTRGQQIPAVFKHTLLVNYLQPFVAMTAKKSADRRVWYLDGYAGPGTYESDGVGGKKAAGSPLLALRTAQKVRSFANPVEMRCAFVEADPAHAELLRQLVGHPQFQSIRARTYEGAIEAHIKTIIREVGVDPLLTFLDPFGTALPWTLLKDSLLNRPRSAPNEVLLNMNVDALRRIGSLPRGATKHKVTLERLDALLGYTEWRATFDAIYRPGQDGSATKAALAVAEDFRRRVRAQTGYDSLAVPVLRDYGQEPIFLMTLFFTHPLALFKYSEAVSLANQKWRLEVAQMEAARYLRSAGTMLWEDDLSPDAVKRKVADDEQARDRDWSTAIASTLRDLLESRSQIPVASNLSAVYGAAFGLAREKHLRRALKLLEDEGLTRPVTGDLSKVTIQRLA